MVSRIPMRVTTVEYSSDERIKTEITTLSKAQKEQILMEMMDIQYSTYGYTEQWQGVRSDIDATSTARGVIAQNIKAMSILGDRVTIHEDNEIGLTEPGFYQVDKQGLTLDLIAALQAHHDHFNIASGEAGSSAAVSIRTDADMTSGSISLVTADAVFLQGKAGRTW